jgi:hypothetical protein
MRFCLFLPDAAAVAPRLGLLDGDVVVDVHLACQTSMVDHMAPKRAREIARALCPPDLVGFLENGRHGWNALDDSLRRLGERLTDPELVAPSGEPVVHRLSDVRVVPVVPWQVRYGAATEAAGRWRVLTVPGTPSTLHTDGRGYLPEYLAVIGAPAERLDVDEAWEAVALVTETRPTDAVDAAVLRTPDELTSDDDVLRTTVAEAVAAASVERRLLVGDVVRTGLALVAHLVDIDLRDEETPVGEALPAH